MPNLDEMASKYFKWKELLLLPTWGVYHNPSEQEIENLKKLAEQMDIIREYLEQPINVNCAIRPSCANVPNTNYNGKNYNKIVGGAPSSAHIKGLAMDFTASTITCDDVRHLLQDKLELWNIRMEMKPGSGWVHIDLMPPNPTRYFKP